MDEGNDEKQKDDKKEKDEKEKDKNEREERDTEKEQSPLCFHPSTVIHSCFCDCSGIMISNF